MFSIKNIEELEKLYKLVSLQRQNKEVRLQDKLGKQNSHEKIEKLFEPLNDTIRKTSEKLTKILTENSNKNNKTLEKLDDKLLEIRNDRGI